jgi:hypothetical protein
MLDFCTQCDKTMLPPESYGHEGGNALSHYLANMGREIPEIKMSVVHRWV